MGRECIGQEVCVTSLYHQEFHLLVVQFYIKNPTTERII